MLVKRWMSKDVTSVDINDSLQTATNLAQRYRPALLPVMKKGKLVGVVTDRDIKRASASDANSLETHELTYLISRIKVGEIMTKPAITISPNHTLEEAAAKLLLNNINGMPVVDESGAIVGIISKQEIFIALITLTGYGKRGVQLAVELEDRPGSIKEITDIIRRYEGRLVSLLTSYQGARPGFRRLYVRARSIPMQSMSRVSSEIKEKATLLYMVDHESNIREEYTDLGRVA